jgi:hypothetical protein
VSVTALAISAGTLFVGLRRASNERKLADVADARECLAAGALALGKTKTTLREAYGRFVDALGNVEKEWPQDTWDWLTKMQDSAEDLETAVAALRIRFKKSDAVVLEATRALDDVRSLALLYRRAAGSLFGSTRNRDELKDSEDGWNLNTSYDAHKDAYLEAAQKLAGAKL